MPVRHACSPLGERWIQASEMRFLLRAKCCTLRDQIRNEEIRDDLNIYSMVEGVEEGNHRACRGQSSVKTSP